MKLWDKGYDIDRFTEEFTIGKDRELDVMLALPTLQKFHSIQSIPQ